MPVLLTVLEPGGWPAFTFVVLVALVGYFLSNLLSKPAFPSKSPPLLQGYPIVGVPIFFSARDALFRMGTAISETGNFSFYFGKIQLVALTGVHARKFFFDSKDLEMSKAYEKLFAVTPKVNQEPGAEEFTMWFNKTVKQMVARGKFATNLATFCNDTRQGIETLISRPTKVMNPYDDVYRMVYQLTMRTVGCEEIAESRELGDKTLALFEGLDGTASPTRLIIPWLPTPRHIKRLILGAQLYMVIHKIVKERERNCIRREDALQVLLDQNTNVTMIIHFIIGSLFAGQINSGINAAAMMVHIAQSPEWMARLREEVDGVIAKRRASEDESPLDVLSRLNLEAWETEFPLIDIALKETIRLELVGTALRLNTSKRPLTIPGSNEIIPPGAYPIYLMDDVHMNPDIYTDPTRWDPGRFERGEDKKETHSFVGWGLGRHPCLGMRFAKLEISLIVAYFIAVFNFQISDQHGNLTTDPPPPKNRGRQAPHKPDVPVYLRYQLRK